MRVCVYMHACVYVHVCVHIHVCVYMCMYIYMYVCACTHYTNSLNLGAISFLLIFKIKTSVLLCEKFTLGLRVGRSR